MTAYTINIANDFSTTPAGRYETDGPYSGERFRNTLLAPALRNHDQVIVDLNGVFGFGSSFLEEAFGGLVRKCSFSKNEVLSKLQIRTSLKTYENKILSYINTAKPESP